MNKAEEQYLYNWGKAEATRQIYQQGLLFLQHFPQDIIEVLDFCKGQAKSLSKDDISHTSRGQLDYYSTIIHAIDFGQIKDWSSFVEYMTGEDYVEEVEKPKCEYCNDTKEVAAPHYTKGGEIPDCDFIKCPKCGGNDE